MDKINDHADRVYCFTESWKDNYLTYGIHKDVRVMEHAVDSMVFSQLPLQARTDCRKNLNIPDDAVIFFNANRNSQRKRLDLTVAGFVEYLSRNPAKASYLVVATNTNPQSGAYYDVMRIYSMELARRSLPIEVYISRCVIIDTSPPNFINDEGINQLEALVTDIGSKLEILKDKKKRIAAEVGGGGSSPSSLASAKGSASGSGAAARHGAP
jgi:hypothetical protein